MLALNSDGECLRVRTATACKPVRGARQRLLGRDDDFRVPPFPLCLFRVSPIRKKDRTGSRNEQHSRAARKPAQVPNIRQMRNKEMIEAVLRYFIACLVQACAV